MFRLLCYVMTALVLLFCSLSVRRPLGRIVCRIWSRNPSLATSLERHQKSEQAKIRRAHCTLTGLVPLFRSFDQSNALNRSVCTLRSRNPSPFVECTYPGMCSKPGQQGLSSTSSESSVSSDFSPTIFGESWVGTDVTKLRRHDPDIYSAFPNPRCRSPFQARRDLSRFGCWVHRLALAHVDGAICMFAPRI